MNCVGVLDSGLGGISTLSSLVCLMPNENYVYVCDKTHLPYGNKAVGDIVTRVSVLVDNLIDHDAKAVVIACNTATSCCVERLRSQYPEIIFVGVEPPIKPACEELKNGKVLVLVTDLTSKQDKFLNLVSRFKDRLIVSVQPELASLIEKNINNLKILVPYVEKIFARYKNENIESVVLGCTHYCLIKSQFQAVFNAKIYDSNAGTAIRLYQQLKQNSKLNRTGGGIKFLKL